MGVAGSCIQPPKRGLHGGSMQLPVEEGLHVIPSKKCHEKGLLLGKENLNSVGSFRMRLNAPHQSRGISKIT